MDYARQTREDPNAFKRWLQRRRLMDALACVPSEFPVDRIVDYGAGDGILAVLALARWPAAHVTAFEPAENLARVADARLSPFAAAEVVRREDQAGSGADILFCTEVFEHLPRVELSAALTHIQSLVRPGGLIVIGVPVEIGLVAIFKGIFRAMRRSEAYDAAPRRILAAALGRPPKDRPVIEIADGRSYHPYHLGFDHRALQRRLRSLPGRLTVRGSPLRFLPSFLNSEVYMILVREDRP